MFKFSPLAVHLDLLSSSESQATPQSAIQWISNKVAANFLSNFCTPKSVYLLLFTLTPPDLCVLCLKEVSALPII